MAPISAEASADELRRIAEQAQQENIELRRQQERITTALEAATAALQALSLGRLQAATPAAANKRKRPELPAFDKSNIHIWIQRVESAYAREDVTDAKQKFAFLESIIGVNLGPTINNFMFGEATAENWTAFLDHLKDTYGPTKEARCSVYLDGVKRNGLRPTDHLALIQDRAKDVSIDDLQKQLIIRELPMDVKKLVQDKVASLDAAATATLADAHFSKDGQPLNNTPSISNVTQRPPPQQVAHHGENFNEQTPEDVPTDVNAVQGRRNRAPQRANNNNNNMGNSRYTPAFGSGTSQPRNRSTTRPNTTPGHTNGHSATPASSSEGRQYSNCKLHAADPASQLCNGPLCPLHSRATHCYSRRCDTHGQAGNGMGGRR